MNGRHSHKLVQFTPPGSGSSIQFGVNLTPAAPGSARAMLLAVSDIEAARSELIAHNLNTCHSNGEFPGVSLSAFIANALIDGCR